MPCQNELDENWGDEDGEFFFLFLKTFLYKNLPNKASKSKVGPLGLGFS
jgi:hypothetical protein